MSLWLPPLALILDLLFADPKRLPHPVQAIGFLANKMEGPARRMKHPVMAGTLVLLILLLLTGSGVALITRLPFGLGICAAIYCAWSGLALGGLIQKCTEALRAIRAAESAPGTLPAARQAVGALVSRDTADMDASALYRSLAESVSENFNDAFVAPYFWLCLGGPVALWIYKTASTMDSMWGYTNERWLYLGRAAARLDDLLAFIPARLSALLLWLNAWLGSLPRSAKGLRERIHAGTFFSLPGWPGYAIVKRQARQSSSPNSGWPMAAAAWIFDGRMGGPTVYDGNLVHKPMMGRENSAWRYANTAALICHVRRSGMLGGLLAVVLTAFIHFF
jgi:adenosylcobinamide-phosphate synthase